MGEYLVLTRIFHWRIKHRVIKICAHLLSLKKCLLDHVIQRLPRKGTKHFSQVLMDVTTESVRLNEMWPRCDWQLQWISVYSFARLWRVDFAVWLEQVNFPLTCPDGQVESLEKYQYLFTFNDKLNPSGQVDVIIRREFKSDIFLFRQTNLDLRTIHERPIIEGQSHSNHPG